MNTYDSDIKKLAALHEVEIIAFPTTKLYRLRDRKILIPHSIVRVEHELTKTVNDFIEEIEVEEVYFKSKYWNDKTKKLFEVHYKTNGYYEYKNDYTNEDFNKEIFISKLELSSILSPILEESKKLFIEKQKQEKESKRIELERQLENLKQN